MPKLRSTFYHVIPHRRNSIETHGIFHVFITLSNFVPSPQLHLIMSFSYNFICIIRDCYKRQSWEKKFSKEKYQCSGFAIWKVQLFEIFNILIVMMCVSRILPLKYLPLMSVDGSLLESSCSLPRCDGVFDGLLNGGTALSFLPGVVLWSWWGKWKAVELGHEAGGGLRTRCSCTCASVRGSASPNSCKELFWENVDRRKRTCFYF